MYMHAVCNHVYWKSPVPPMKVHGCQLTFKPSPVIIKYHFLRFISKFNFLLCVTIRQKIQSQHSVSPGGVYGGASSFAHANTLIWGLITTPL